MVMSMNIAVCTLVVVNLVFFSFGLTENSPDQRQFCRESQGVVVNNRALTGHVFKSFSTREIFSCAHKCSVHDSCGSYNYQLASGKQDGVCELSREVALNEEHLEERPGFVFVRLQRKQTPKSCQEVWNQGSRTSGFYVIEGRSELLQYEMYCDFTSEPGWAWTLVMSQSFANRETAFARDSLLKGGFKSQDAPNWEKYKIGKGRMWILKALSTHWRVTCSFPTHGVDYKDYARAKIENLNPISYEASGECREMEYINIRGHNCTQCSAAWWQTEDQFLTHFSDQNVCQFAPTRDSVNNEANFGGYDGNGFNPDFRCTSGDSASTNHWFGGRV